MAPDLDEFDEPGRRTSEPASVTEPTTQPGEPTKDRSPAENTDPDDGPLTKAARSPEPEPAEDTDPDAPDPETHGSDALDPGAHGPEAVDPEAVDPEAVDPEAVDPEAVGSEAVDPEAVDREAVGSEALDPDAVEPEAHEPEADEAFGPETLVPGALEPVAGPDYAEPWPAEPVPAMARVRALTILAVGPLTTGYLAIATLMAIITGIAGNARFTTSGVLTAALPGWLAAHQVPIEIGGLELGVLPLLPTVGVALITGRAAARAAERLDLRRPGQAGPVIATVLVAHAVAGLVVAALCVDAVVSPDPLAALFYPALVAGSAATIGVARPCGLAAGLARRADAAAVEGLRAGLLAFVLLLAAGGAVVTFGLLTSVTTARDMFPSGVGDAVGMLLLSIGYLPNAMVAAVSFVAGPGFTLGTVGVSPLEFHGGHLPEVPLLAALPEHQAAWWPALFLLPLVIGVVLGRGLRHVDEDPVVRLRAVAIATGVVAVSVLVVAGMAGGRLGGGAFDPVSMRAAATSVVLVLWMAVAGGIAAWFGGPRPATEPLPGLIDDEPEDEQPEVPEPRDAVEVATD